MSSRMNKYDTTSVKSRTEKNEKLYDEVLDMSIDYVNINVDNAIDLTEKDGIGAREKYHKQRELKHIMPDSDEKIISDIAPESVEPKENRVYDINEILKLARDNKLFEDEDKKRLINTEYNILTKLDVGELSKENINKEDIKSLINDIYEREKPVKVKKYSMKEEERLLNELFDDKMDDDLSEELKLKEELSKKILDNDLEQEDQKEILEKEMQSLDTDEQDIVGDFETKEFKKDSELDLEDELKKELLKEEKQEEKEEKKEQEDEDDDDEEYVVKEGKGLLIAIIVVSILILLTCGFFAYAYFIGI